MPRPCCARHGPPPARTASTWSSSAPGSRAPWPQGLTPARRDGSYLVAGQYTDAGGTELKAHQIVYRQLDLVGSGAFTGAHLVEYVRLLPALAARFDLESMVTVYPPEHHADALADVAADAVLKAVLSG
ncbi:hypothetical protein ACWC2T_31670 [Streptomyces sp. NPDC001393]